MSKKKPPVDLQYVVATDGATERKSMKYVMGVMAGLSGHRQDAALSERSFEEVHKGNFDKTMEKIAPELRYHVKNTLDDDGTEVPVDLRFRSMADFEPARIAAQIPSLKHLLEERERVIRALGRVARSDQLAKVIADTIASTSARSDASTKGSES